MAGKVTNTREQLILAGIEEINIHGVTEFSIRRVAAACHVSCAAPYKHFSGREELILEVVKHINQKWDKVRNETVAGRKDASEREILVAVCMAYLTFLCTYPEYQMILFMNDRVFPVEVAAEKGKLSTTIETLIKDYCERVSMPDEVRRRKQLVISSILCGAAEMINSGAVPFHSQTIATIREAIENEISPQ